MSTHRRFLGLIVAVPLVASLFVAQPAQAAQGDPAADAPVDHEYITVEIFTADKQLLSTTTYGADTKGIPAEEDGVTPMASGSGGTSSASGYSRGLRLAATTDQ